MLCVQLWKRVISAHHARHNTAVAGASLLNACLERPYDWGVSIAEGFLDFFNLEGGPGCVIWGV
jgi:hypothetical protein